ncbi:hypothetical protein UY3_10691 [Chelonia mydas]|uniref:Uncharacterized protein n=1 Tax=Chelonia mydas TaxID=8469 RepID=M7B4X0_CHEMY|nr:hypothetical protein UY3_10691 [Chelonia mydas]
MEKEQMVEERIIVLKWMLHAQKWYKFELTRKVYKKKFQGVQKTQGMTCLELVTLMGEYTRKSVNGAGAQTKEDVIELMGLKRLYELCPPDLRMWLVDKRAKDLHRAGLLADEFIDSRSGYEMESQGDRPTSVQKGVTRELPRRESWINPSQEAHPIPELTDRPQGTNRT